MKLKCKVKNSFYQCLQKEREELERMKAMRSQRTNPHGPAKEGSIRGGSGLPSKSQNRSDSGCFGRLYSSNDQESSVGRGHRFTSHRLTGQRRRNGKIYLRASDDMFLGGGGGLEFLVCWTYQYQFTVGANQQS